MRFLIAVVLITSVLFGCSNEVGQTITQDAANKKVQMDSAVDTINRVKIQKAIDTYNAQNGAYPESLDVLVPDYLPVMPKKADGSQYDYDANNGKLLQ